MFMWQYAFDSWGPILMSCPLGGKCVVLAHYDPLLGKYLLYSSHVVIWKKPTF